MKNVDTTVEETETMEETPNTEKKVEKKTDKKFPLSKKEMIIGGASFLVGVLTGIGSLFGFQKIKSSNKVN